MYTYKTMAVAAVAAVGIALSSCGEWFDESPKTDIKAGDFFESENGFQSSLTGIYLSMTGQDAYSGNMSFGLMDQLAQQYDYLPDGAADMEAVYNYSTQTSYGFNTKGRLASSWRGMYNIVANCNNLLKWLGTNGERVLRDSVERNMMRGEALAVRAFCHFDLLRAWGPWNLRNDPGAMDANAIPYRTAADNSKQPRLSTHEVLARVVADLEEAAGLLAYESRTPLEGSTRRFRFNYHAVNALLARVHSYAGDAAKAAEYARKVISGCGLELQTSNQNDPVMFSECICALNMYGMGERLSAQWAEGEKFTTQYAISQEKFNTLFEVAGTRREDIRSKGAAFHTYDATRQNLSRKYSTNPNQALPLIRLPEMYYILCEAEEDMAKAREHINYVRGRRGYSKASDEKFTDSAGRLNALDREYRKEFYAEGQYWYFLKLHGRTEIPYAAGVALGKERFEFPLPDAEVQYGWTADSAATGI